MVESAIDKNRVSVRTRLMDRLNPVWGDRVQLQQVVLNLILNAVEAMSSIEEGARELSISSRQGQTSDLLVAVQDSGPGIDLEHTERAFAPFYTTKTNGIGMGLSICRSIIAAHGGSVVGRGQSTSGRNISVHSAPRRGRFISSLEAASQIREPNEGTVPDARHPRACRGNRRSHRSGRFSGRPHPGMR